MTAFLPPFCNSSNLEMVSTSAIILFKIPNLPPTHLKNCGFLPSQLPKSQSVFPRRQKGFLCCAQNGDVSKDSGERENGNKGGEDLRRDSWSLLNFRWRDLLDPDPENIVAVGLTGLLTWASVQVLWQLFFISIAILVAALKYSFVAALLLFILITLL